MRRRITGLDLNGRVDVAARDWSSEDAALRLDPPAIIDGGVAAPVVVAGGDARPRLIAGPQAILAPHGSGEGWGRIGAADRRRPLSAAIDHLGEDADHAAAVRAAVDALARCHRRRPRGPGPSGLRRGRAGCDDRRPPASAPRAPPLALGRRLPRPARRRRAAARTSRRALPHPPPRAGRSRRRGPHPARRPRAPRAPRAASRRIRSPPRAGDRPRRAFRDGVDPRPRLEPRCRLAALRSLAPRSRPRGSRACCA